MSDITVTNGEEKKNNPAVIAEADRLKARIEYFAKLVEDIRRVRPIKFTDLIRLNAAMGQIAAATKDMGELIASNDFLNANGMNYSSALSLGNTAKADASNAYNDSIGELNTEKYSERNDDKNLRESLDIAFMERFEEFAEIKAKREKYKPFSDFVDGFLKERREKRSGDISAMTEEELKKAHRDNKVEEFLSEYDIDNLKIDHKSSLDSICGLLEEVGIEFKSLRDAFKKVPDGSFLQKVISDELQVEREIRRKQVELRTIQKEGAEIEKGFKDKGLDVPKVTPEQKMLDIQGIIDELKCLDGIGPEIISNLEAVKKQAEIGKSFDSVLDDRSEAYNKKIDEMEASDLEFFKGVVVDLGFNNDEFRSVTRKDISSCSLRDAMAFFDANILIINDRELDCELRADVDLSYDLLLNYNSDYPDRREGKFKSCPLGPLPPEASVCDSDALEECRAALIVGGVAHINNADPPGDNTSTALSGQVGRGPCRSI